MVALGVLSESIFEELYLTSSKFSLWSFRNNFRKLYCKQDGHQELKDVGEHLQPSKERRPGLKVQKSFPLPPPIDSLFRNLLVGASNPVCLF